MTQHLVLFTIGGCVLALVAAALVLLFRGAEEQTISRRVSRLRQGAEVATRARAPSILSALFSLMKNLGNAMRGRLLSSHDLGALAKSLAAAGFEPSKAIPLFMSAKAICLFGIPALVYAGVVTSSLRHGKTGTFCSPISGSGNDVAQLGGGIPPPALPGRAAARAS